LVFVSSIIVLSPGACLREAASAKAGESMQVRGIRKSRGLYGKRDDLKENPIFQKVKPITLFGSFHSLKLRLWDEKNQRIVSFREMRKSEVLSDYR